MATHEGLGELSGEAILITMTPKVWQRHREGVLVVPLLSRKLIQHKGTPGQVSKGLLGLWLSSQRHSDPSVSSGVGAEDVKILNRTSVTYRLTGLDSHFT